MSQFPPPPGFPPPPPPGQQPQGMNYQSYGYAPTTQQLPGNIRGVAITGIILGSLGSLCYSLGSVGVLMVQRRTGSNAQQNAMLSLPVMLAYNVACLVLSVMFLCAGIRTFAFRAWVRKIFIIGGLTQLGISVIVGLIDVINTLPLIQARMNNAPPGILIGLIVGMIFRYGLFAAFGLIAAIIMSKPYAQAVLNQ